MKKSLYLGASILALNVFSLPALAEEALEARINKLEQEIAILKRQAEIEKEEATKKAQTTPSVELSKKGFSVKSADKSFEMTLKGLVQVDGRFFTNDKNDTGTDQFILRKMRPSIQGYIFNSYNYSFVPEFGGGQTRVVDAYIEKNAAENITLRAGKFKPPVGLEQLQSDPNVGFTERGLPTDLVPNRDVGLQAYGNLLHNTLEYQLGIFNGTTDGGNSDTDTDDSKEVAGRLFATPFANSNILKLQGLGVGIAGSLNETDGSTSNTELDVYKTPGQTTFFRYRSGTGSTVFADGTHYRFTPQAYYYVNSFGILGEYVISSQDVHVGTNKATLDNRAWGITTSYVLTGEDASFLGVKPASVFDWKKGIWGAFEVVGRYGELEIDDKAFPLYADASASARKATDLAAGANWYLNDNVRLTLDYDFVSFDGGASKGGDRPDEQVISSRLQYKF